MLADETRVLARASCGSVKLMRVSEAEATERLRGLLVEVSKQSGVGLGEISRTCMGLAGLSIAAVRAGLWARDRGVPTGLLEAIEEAWGAGSLGELVEMGNGQPGPDFAALAPVVAKCAAGGDELAGAVLARAGAELAEQVALVELKLVEFGGAGGEVGLAYTGSVLEKIAPVREAMVEALRETAPAVRVLSGAVDSLAGALWRARGGQ